MWLAALWPPCRERPSNPVPSVPFWNNTPEGRTIRGPCSYEVHALDTSSEGRGQVSGRPLWPASPHVALEAHRLPDARKSSQPSRPKAEASAFRAVLSFTRAARRLHILVHEPMHCSSQPVECTSLRLHRHHRHHWRRAPVSTANERSRHTGQRKKSRGRRGNGCSGVVIVYR